LFPALNTRTPGSFSLASGPVKQSKSYDLFNIFLFCREYALFMNRFFLCFAVVVFSICAQAQGTSQPPAPAASAPDVTTTASPAVQQFQKIEDAWSNAVNQHDQYGLENVLSPLFVDVAANGDITTRNQQVVQVIGGQDKWLWLTQKVITVRMLGDIAVANGTYSLRHKTGSQPIEEKGVFTHVFERTHGGWVCINSQRTVLREDASGKQKKSSTTDEPFHIPLFSHSEKNSQ
jgi:ketosteroid isomerase-like protein